jgi:hypothetical protein
MKKYVGIREHGVAKFKSKEPGKGRVLLNPRFKLRSRSPTGCAGPLHGLQVQRHRKTAAGKELDAHTD